MSKRTLSWAAILTAGAAAVVALLLALPPTNGQEAGSGTAEALLRRTAAHYGGVQTQQNAVSIDQDVIQGGVTETRTRTVEFSLQRPNKLHFRADTGDSAVTMVSDGKNLTTFVGRTNKYMVEEAPDDLAELAENRVLLMATLGMGGTLLGPFGADPYEAMGRNAVKMSVVQPPEGARQDAHVLRIETDEGHVDLYVGKEEPLILEVRKDLWKFIEEIKKQNPAVGDLKVVYYVRFKEAASQVEIAPETFAFRAPDKALKALDIEYLFSMEDAPIGDFKLPGLKEDTTFHLADYRGKVIVMTFFARRCPPCRMELPELQELYENYKDKDFAMVAVNVGESREEANGLVQELGLTMPVAMDEQSRVFRGYGFSALPSLMVVGKDGIVSKVHVGYRRGLERVLAREVDKLLAE